MYWAYVVPSSSVSVIFQLVYFNLAIEIRKMNAAEHFYPVVVV